MVVTIAVFLVLMLLLVGPAAASWLYWTVQNHYRNTDKSHDFEHETAVAARPVTGSARKLDQVKGMKNKRIENENVGEHRKRL